jgi:hypothetical protein
MHFNHFIQAQDRKVITSRYLIRFIARGAAVFSAKCHPCFDIAFRYLFGSTDLEEKNVVIQVRNDSKVSQPGVELFRKMDPFQCDLLDESGVDGCFPIPIIRMVFVLYGKESTVSPMQYLSPSDGASPSSFGEYGQPRFISYDYWCSGTGPGLLQPVGEGDMDWRWNLLLKEKDQWASFYSDSQSPAVLRSTFPAGSSDEPHSSRWFPDE